MATLRDGIEMHWAVHREMEMEGRKGAEGRQQEEKQEQAGESGGQGGKHKRTRGIRKRVKVKQAQMAVIDERDER